MIDIQHGSLRAFKQHALAGADGVVQQLRGIAHQRPEALGVAQVLIANRFEIDGFLDVEGLRQQLLVLGQRRIHRAEAVVLIKIGDADAAAPDFVFVTGADAARSGSDGHAILPALRHFFDDAMKRENDVRAIADGELLADIDARTFQHFHLLDQRRGIDDHSVADHGLDSRPQNAARNQLENKLLGADEHGVPGVVAALVASHHRKLLGEEVDDLTLALVTPLRTQYDDVSHVRSQNLLIVPCALMASRETHASGNAARKVRRTTR